MPSADYLEADSTEYFKSCEECLLRPEPMQISKTERAIQLLVGIEKSSLPRAIFAGSPPNLRPLHMIWVEMLGASHGTKQNPITLDEKSHCSHSPI